MFKAAAATRVDCSRLVGYCTGRRACSRQLAGLTTRHYHGESKSYQDSEVANIRNIGIIAHVDAGKTTTTERMLYFSGQTRSLGNVDDRNTVTDFLPLERERGITIQSAAVTMRWPLPQDCRHGEQPRTINLIDTPGHQDFGFEVTRAIPELDGGILILDATKGVETNTEKVWALAREYDVPNLIFVNKHDMDGASMKKCVLEIATVLNTFPLVLQIPWWDKDEYVGHVDVVNETGMTYSATGILSRHAKGNLAPATREELQRAREHLQETLVENDDQLMEKFAEGTTITAAMLKSSIRKLTMDGRGKFSPVLCGASLRNMGVQPLMDAVVDYLPSPADRPELKVMVEAKTVPLSHVLEAESQKKRGGGKGHATGVGAVAHVFKMVDDPQYGMMSYVRVHHGQVSKGETWNTRSQEWERPRNIMQIFADKRVDISHLSAGQIGALTGLKQARTGDTLVASATANKTVPESLRAVHIKPPEIPPGVAFISMDPYSRTAAEKLEDALSRLSRVDPSLQYHHDEKTQQYVVSAQGKLHLEVAFDRLKNYYKISSDDVLISPIQVEYRETLTASKGPTRHVPSSTQGPKTGITVDISPLHEAESESGPSPSERLRVERNGNVIEAVLLPRLAANGITPLPFGFEVDLVLRQMVNGATGGMARGPRRGWPMRKCLARVVLRAAEYSAKDGAGTSSPSAGGHVQAAARQAVREALRQAHEGGITAVLEPFMAVRVLVPEASAANIQHDLSSRRGGQVLEVRSSSTTTTTEKTMFGSASGLIDAASVYAPPDPFMSVTSLRAAKTGRKRLVEIVARAPLKDMLRYDETLRELTGGRSRMSMEADSFELVQGQRLKALDSMHGWE